MKRFITECRFLVVACGLVLLNVCATSAVNAQGAANNTKRWAIISTDEEGRALADLLTVELSAWKNVELLERERIRGLLAELQLNASRLVDAESATRFGQLSQADALALIDVRKEDDKTRVVRLRLVDTRTSIRLLDVLLPGEDLETQVGAIREELRDASATLDVPADQLRLIGLAPISSGEPGEFLRPFCKTLTALVEVGLQQNPQFVVVERSELQRLVAESDLTGLPLQLRASSRLLEATVRRANDGAGMLASCRLISGAGGELQKFDVLVASIEAIEMRQQLIAAIVRKMDSVGEEKKLSLEAEAKVFDRRATLFRNANQEKEAVEMAAAALALSPSKERLGAALNYLLSIANDNKDLHEGLEAGVRYQQLRVDWWAKTKPGDPIRSTLTGRPYYSHDVNIPWGRFRKPGDGPLIDAWFALSEQVYEQLYRDATGPRRLSLLKEKLSFSILRDKAGIAAVLAQIQQLIENEPIPLDSKSVAYADYARLLMSAAEVNHWRVRRQLLKGPGEPAIRLGDEDELAVWLAKLYANVLYSDDSDAALELLSFLDRWPPAMLGPSSESFPFPRTPQGDRLAREKLHTRSYFRFIRSKVLKRHPGIVVSYVEIVLQETEESGDATKLMRLGSIVYLLPIRIPADQQEQLSSRLFAAITSYTHSAHSHEVAKLTIFANRYAPREKKPEFTYAERKGPWRRYSKVPIKLSGGNLLSAFVDHRPDARQAGGDVVLVWSAGRGCQLERLDLASKTTRKIGPVIPRVGSDHYRHYQIAFGPEAVFVPLREGGFAMVRKDTAEVFTEKHGAPASDIWNMAWCNGRLYIGYTDAFASFDPKTKTFQLLASSASIEPTTPIDGRGGFFILHMFSDEANRCLWMFIQDNARSHERAGPWKFDLQTNTYQKLGGGHPIPTRTDGGLLLHNTSNRSVHYLDTKTAELTDLTEYASVMTGIQTPSATIKVGDHIIIKRGTLYTPDGEEHLLKPEAKWKLLQRAGHGFITHYDERSATLWYFKRNSTARVWDVRNSHLPELP
ncbi:MAG: hypothetical protein ISR77_27750 [Pirellulaceae bacterium]|nr:hypothetical protein [Pirellulaceae bacterium]